MSKLELDQESATKSSRVSTLDNALISELYLRECYLTYTFTQLNSLASTVMGPTSILGLKQIKEIEL